MGYSIEREGIRIYVEDSGVGIPEELQERVFGRFQKLNEFAQGVNVAVHLPLVGALDHHAHARLGAAGAHHQAALRVGEGVIVSATALL